MSFVTCCPAATPPTMLVWIIRLIFGMASKLRQIVPPDFTSPPPGAAAILAG